jgi:hypothetical protein
MSKPRRSYTREFKAEAVKMLTQQGISAGEAGRWTFSPEKQAQDLRRNCCPEVIRPLTMPAVLFAGGLSGTGSGSPT